MDKITRRRGLLLWNIWMLLEMQYYISSGFSISGSSCSKIVDIPCSWKGLRGSMTSTHSALAAMAGTFGKVKSVPGLDYQYSDNNFRAFKLWGRWVPSLGCSFLRLP